MGTRYMMMRRAARALHKATPAAQIGVIDSSAVFGSAHINRTRDECDMLVPRVLTRSSRLTAVIWVRFRSSCGRGRRRRRWCRRPPGGGRGGGGSGGGGSGIPIVVVVGGGGGRGQEEDEDEDEDDFNAVA